MTSEPSANCYCGTDVFPHWVGTGRYCRPQTGVGERSDLPEGQQSKLSWSEAIARSKAAFDEVEWRRQTLAEHEAAEMLCCCDEAAVVARVRAEVAEQLRAYALNYPAEVFPPDSDVRDAIAGTAMRHAYNNAARLVEEAGKGFPSPAGRLDRVWWLHRCVDSNPALTWFSDLVAADVPRPERCPSCGTAANEGWFNVAKIDRLPKE